MENNYLLLWAAYKTAIKPKALKIPRSVETRETVNFMESFIAHSAIFPYDAAHF